MVFDRLSAIHWKNVVRAGPAWLHCLFSDLASLGCLLRHPPPILPSRPIQDLHVPYVFPQECGGRADVRWLYLTPQQQQQQQQQGLLIAAATPTPSSSSSTLQMNISPYSWQALTAAKHQHELTPDPLGWHLHVDAAHMGVGGDDSWSPSVHDEYLVPPGKYQLGLVMRAAGGGERGPGLFAAAKQLQASATTIAGVV
jgi:hypothetical protein